MRVGSIYMFKMLFNIIRLILITSNSNSGEKKRFYTCEEEQVRRNHRNKLDIERSLSLILAVKLDWPQSVQKSFDCKSEKNILNAAKKASFIIFHISSWGKLENWFVLLGTFLANK